MRTLARYWPRSFAASAATCVNAVYAPVPMSIPPLAAVTVPSA